jgi:hypothetical protein
MIVSSPCSSTRSTCPNSIHLVLNVPRPMPVVRSALRCPLAALWVRQKVINHVITTFELTWIIPSRRGLIAAVFQGRYRDWPPESSLWEGWRVPIVGTLCKSNAIHDLSEPTISTGVDSNTSRTLKHEPFEDGVGLGALVEAQKDL